MKRSSKPRRVEAQVRPHATEDIEAVLAIESSPSTMPGPRPCLALNSSNERTSHMRVGPVGAVSDPLWAMWGPTGSS